MFTQYQHVLRRMKPGILPNGADNKTRVARFEGRTPTDKSDSEFGEGKERVMVKDSIHGVLNHLLSKSDGRPHQRKWQGVGRNREISSLSAWL